MPRQDSRLLHEDHVDQLTLKLNDPSRCCLTADASRAEPRTLGGITEQVTQAQLTSRMVSARC